MLSGQRFWWTYDSHEDVGALSNNSQIGNPMADWDANRTDADPLTDVIVPGLRRSVEVRAENGASRSDRTLITRAARPAPLQKWDSLQFRVQIGSAAWWATVPVSYAHSMASGDSLALDLLLATGAIQFNSDGNLRITNLSASVRLTVRLVHWL